MDNLPSLNKNFITIILIFIILPLNYFIGWLLVIEARLFYFWIYFYVNCIKISVILQVHVYNQYSNVLSLMKFFKQSCTIIFDDNSYKNNLKKAVNLFSDMVKIKMLHSKFFTVNHQASRMPVLFYIFWCMIIQFIECMFISKRQIRIHQRQ